jgi:hypothetical protein
MENGHVKPVQAPLGYPSVTALLEYVLVTKKNSNYLCTDTGNWINAATDDFPIHGVEAAYDWYMKYSDYLCTDTGNWKARTKHAFTFSAAMCYRDL